MKQSWIPELILVTVLVAVIVVLKIPLGVVAVSFLTAVVIVGLWKIFKRFVA